MTIIYNSTDISTSVVSATVTKSVNTFYDTATLQTSISLQAFNDISIDSVFDGFVYSSTRNGRASYNIECRSHTARLTTPFESESVNVVEEATTSHDLCSQYTADYGYPIVNESENLTFGGGYERTGTPLSALANIANVTGSEYYHFNGGIKITPKIGIKNISPKVILPTEIHNFIPESSTIENQGIRYIIIGTEPTPDSVTTSYKCDVTVDPCDGYTVANIIGFSSSEGIVLNLVNSVIHKDGVLNAAYTLQLDTTIVSITHIYIGGAELTTGFSFVSDTIVFDTEQSGIFYVEYIGQQYVGYANITTVNGQRYTEFNIYYGNCERYSYASILDCNDDNGYRQCEESLIITPKTMNYVAGFYVTAITETPPVFQFYSDQSIFDYTPTVTSVTAGWVDKGILSQYGSVWRHKLRFHTTSISEIRSAGTTIQAGDYTINGEYVDFTRYYKDVLIAYQINAYEYFIQFINQIDKNMKMLVGGCEYSLEGLDATSTSSVICAEGVDIPIDVGKELGVIYGVAYKTISMSDPNGVVSNIVTDYFGIAIIPNCIFGTYILNTSNIVNHSTITVEIGVS